MYYIIFKTGAGSVGLCQPEIDFLATVLGAKDKRPEDVTNREDCTWGWEAILEGGFELGFNAMLTAYTPPHGLGRCDRAVTIPVYPTAADAEAAVQHMLSQCGGTTPEGKLEGYKFGDWPALPPTDWYVVQLDRVDLKVVCLSGMDILGPYVCPKGFVDDSMGSPRLQYDDADDGNVDEDVTDDDHLRAVNRRYDRLEAAERAQLAHLIAASGAKLVGSWTPDPCA